MKNILISFFVLGFTWVSVAEAIPAFARKHEAKCTACHTVWPSLNAMGRTYKENGYRLSREGSTDGMGWDKTPLISTMLKARPFEDTDSGAKKLRVLHEVELMIAGEFAEDFSGFLEIEAEDDKGDKGFAPELPVAVIGWHPTEAANIQLSWGPSVWSDPYDVYSNARKLTRNRASVYNQKFEGADNGGKLRSARQNFTLYGRPIEQLFYSVSVNGIGGDPIAENGEIFSGRLAFDVMPSVMVGAMAMSGTCVASEFVTELCNVERKFTRTSIDAQAEFGSFRIMGAFMQATGDNEAGTNKEKNQAMFGEARYIISENGRPTWMPLIRVDSYEKKDGADEYFEVTLHLSHYFKENVRAFIEYLDKSAPDSANDDYTLTAQLELGF